MYKIILFFITIITIGFMLISCNSNDGITGASTASSKSGTTRSTGSGTSSSFSSGSIVLEISYVQGTIFNTDNKNIYVIWIENTAQSFIQNIYICNKLIAGGLTGTALPYWKTQVYPVSDTGEIDGVTGATKGNQNFTVQATLKDKTKRQFRICFEIDESYESNDWFLQDQPAVLYTADVDLDNTGVTTYVFSPAGWTPNENVVNNSGNRPYTGLTLGNLQPEMRYITNHKNGSVFGAADTSKSSTLAVGSITLTIK